MQLPIRNPAFQEALIKRLVKEIGETFVANVGLDILSDQLFVEKEELVKQVALLKKEIEELNGTISSLRTPIVYNGE